jgi:hypothetical protein
MAASIASSSLEKSSGCHATATYATERVAYNVDLVVAQRAQDCGHVVPLSLKGKGPAAECSAAVSLKVNCDYRT